MAKIYISSTFQDLKECRDEVYRSLRQLQHDVVGMEDYVAEGSRPLAKCLQDVESCELYVGLFAFRYGYVPDEPMNPHKWSITECEYRHAQQLGKECLIFLLDPEADWPPSKTDYFTGENDRGGRINALRAELGTRHVGSMFKNRILLAGLVSNAVSLWERRMAAQPPEQEQVPATPLMREVRYATLLAYSDAQDEMAAVAFAERLRQRGLGVLQVPRTLFARTEADLHELEAQVISCHAAAVWLTPTFVDQIKAHADEVARVLDLLAARTGCLIGLLAGIAATALPAAWQFTKTIDVAIPEADALVQTAIATSSPTVRERTVGLPYVIIAMTATEARELFDNHASLQNELKPASYEQFIKLKEALESQGDPVARYGAMARDWKPFGDKSVQTITGEIARRLNGQSEPGPRHRCIKLQEYPFHGWRCPEFGLRSIYRGIAATGCVAIVDEMSLFQRDLRKASVSFVGSSQVAVVTVSPLDASDLPVNQLLESETRQQLAGAFERFEMEFDPACEFGVGEERRLKRWLHASMPEALDNLRAPPPDRRKLENFRELIGIDRKRGIDGAIYVGGGAV